jgi:hypothetical protein
MRLVQPVDKHVSPYLLQPLRSYEQVQQDRERRQREAADTAAQPQPAAATGPSTPKAPGQIDQSV